MAGGKPNYDSRATKARNLIAELLRMGVVPSTVEIDGLRIEVGSYAEPRPEGPKHVPGVLAMDEIARTTAASNVRSYRQRAREDLRNRIRESEEGKS
jgi:hypothetical protein